MTFFRKTNQLVVFMAIGIAMLLARSGTALAQDPTGTQPPTTQPKVPVTFSVSGLASSGTAGVKVPPGLQITLHVAQLQSDGKLPIETLKRESVITAESTFKFDGISAMSGDIAFVTLVYDGVVQGSALAQLTPDQPTLNLSVTLYAVTNDPNVISLISVQHILDLKPGNTLQVLATYDYKNNSDRVYLAKDKTDQGDPISLIIPLPVGARGVAFNTQPVSRFSLGGDINFPVVRDTKAVLPGQTHEIVFSYQIPYDAGIPIDQDYPYNTLSVSVIVPNDSSLKINDEQFKSEPNNAINPNRPFTQYTLKNPLRAGDRLKYGLGGPLTLPTQPPSQFNTTVGSSFNSGIIFFALGTVILVAAAGMILFQRLRR